VPQFSHVKPWFWAALLMALPPDRRSDLQSGVQGSVCSRCSSALGVRAAPRLGAGEGPVHRLVPSSGSAITSASCFTEASLSRRIRTSTGFRWIVPVTVSRASSAASGRCHPVLTGVGAVPCDQSAAVPVLHGRRISPPSYRHFRRSQHTGFGEATGLPPPNGQVDSRPAPATGPGREAIGRSGVRGQGGGAAT
jgi:hypothetical protein